jgi:transcriptional regulator with XRE-family HTH domain
MEEDVLIQISNRIKERRREKNITVQELATRVSVSKGLISQVENSRTIPSLIVLIDIIKALEIDLNEFFKDIRSREHQNPILIKRKSEYEHFEKEHTTGFNYQRIFTRYVSHSTIDIVLLELEPDSERPLVKTEAFEYKYIVSGDVDYLFEDQQVSLHEGDSILFNGRIAHSPKNMGKTKVTMLVVYFFEERTDNDVPELG